MLWLPPGSCAGLSWALMMQRLLMLQAPLHPVTASRKTSLGLRPISPALTSSREASPAPRASLPGLTSLFQRACCPGQSPLGEGAPALVAVRRNPTALIPPGFSFQIIHVAKMFSTFTQAMSPCPGAGLTSALALWQSEARTRPQAKDSLRLEPQIHLQCPASALTLDHNPGLSPDTQTGTPFLSQADHRPRPSQRPSPFLDQTQHLLRKRK